MFLRGSSCAFDIPNIDESLRKETFMIIVHSKPDPRVTIIAFGRQHVVISPTSFRTGYYAGFIGSALGFGRFLSSYFWGYMADSIGRKPVLILGLASTAVGSTAFGLSTTFAFAVSSR